MGSYEFMEHTADEKFLIRADDYNDAFATAVQAFYSVMLGDQTLAVHSHTRNIHLKASRIESLLYDFLNELIYYFDAEDLLLPQVRHMNISNGGEGGYHLEAVLAGTTHYEYALETEIKNMTYSEMEIKRLDDGTVEMTVVVDI
ncbi:MAG: archease [Candidatus Woesearchaeota archaeon]